MIFNNHHTNFSYYFFNDRCDDITFGYYNTNNCTFHPDIRTFKLKILNFVISECTLV